MSMFSSRCDLCDREHPWDVRCEDVVAELYPTQEEVTAMQARNKELQQENRRLRLEVVKLKNKVKTFGGR